MKPANLPHAPGEGRYGESALTTLAIGLSLGEHQNMGVRVPLLPKTLAFLKHRLLCRRCFFGLVLLLPFSGLAQLHVGIDFQDKPLVSVTGPVNAPCEVQWSDSLTNSSRWFFLTNGVLTNGFQVSDPAASMEPRFYRAVQVPEAGMVLVPGGSFAMGDTFSEQLTNERPVHDVAVSGFFMDRHEVTRFKWDTVVLWAESNGYNFAHTGGGKGANHPVHTVSWHDVVKWCNARSEMEGRSAVYFTSAAQTNIYRTGQINLSNQCVRWAADGYRLPTEAEWEKAARGGQGGWRFPWGNTISHSNANYYATASYSYDTGGTNQFHPAYDTGDFPFTSPVGAFPANTYGLNDMVGNVWEWCWDAYDPAWYQNPLASEPDPRGPGGAVTNRVLRGGSWIDVASFGRCANRTYTLFQAPTTANDALGFRCVISLIPPVEPAVLENAALLANGAFRFTLSNLTPGKTTVVAVSTNLVNWTPVWTNIPAAAGIEYTNTSTSPAGNVFYRAWQVP